MNHNWVFKISTFELQNCLARCTSWTCCIAVATRHGDLVRNCCSWCCYGGSTCWTIGSSMHVITVGGWGYCCIQETSVHSSTSMSTSASSATSSCWTKSSAWSVDVTNSTSSRMCAVLLGVQEVMMVMAGMSWCLATGCSRRSANVMRSRSWIWAHRTVVTPRSMVIRPKWVPSLVEQLRIHLIHYN